MEKLIDLLSRGAKNDDWCLVRIEGNVRKFDERLIISKSYGFIKWLVENDKIDTNKYENILDRIEYYSQSEEEKERHYYSDYESLLMLLSIQNEPLEFLNNILK